MTTKAKRKLSDISFAHEGAHVALVSKDQGGPANGHDYALVMKATNFSPEFITKMQQVKVTMELPEFLRKFFGLWYEDSEILARFMGYVEPENEELTDDPEDYYDQYIQSKVDQFEVVKALSESKDIAADILALGEEKYLRVLKSQAKLEKVIAKIEKNSAKVKSKAEEGSTEAVTKVKQSDESKTKVEPSVSVNKGKIYMDELEEVKKALSEQTVQLTKALETIAAFEAKEKEMISKSRFEKLKSAVKDESKASTLFKAMSLLESDEDFDAAVLALSQMQEVIEKSNLFSETGANVESQETIDESKLAKVIKANLKAGK